MTSTTAPSKPASATTPKHTKHTEHGGSDVQVMSEGKIINKYTLVPVGAVLAAVAITLAVSSSFRGETDRILVLETKVEQADKERVDLRSQLNSINSKLEAQNVTLSTMSAQLAVLNATLDRRLGPDGKPRNP